MGTNDKDILKNSKEHLPRTNKLTEQEAKNVTGGETQEFPNDKSTLFRDPLEAIAQDEDDLNLSPDTGYTGNEGVFKK